jgi:prephenate dehydratase
MALRQCDNFLHLLPGVRKVECFDTAGAARDVAEKKLFGHAAVCPKLAASLYGLNVLQEGIETNKRNFTRFLLVADPILAAEIGPGERDVNKASVVFTLPHNKGALSRVLSILSFYDINLTKIQSMPIIGREWEYRFYLDVTFDSTVRYHQAIDAIRPLINDFKTLGLYCESSTSEQHD